MKYLSEVTEINLFFEFMKDKKRMRPIKSLYLNLAIIIFLWATPYAYGKIPDTSLQTISDSLNILIKTAEQFKTQGELIKNDETLEEAKKYFLTTTSSYSQDEEPLIPLRFEIYNALGWSKIYIKEFSLAMTLFEELLEKTPENYHLYLSKTYTGISSVYGMQKDYTRSKQYALLSLDEAEKAEDNEAEYLALANLGDIYIELEEYEQALAQYLEVRKLSILIQKNEAISIANLALAYYKLGKDGFAEQYFTESLSMSKDSLPIIYSIVLPTYCEFLLEKGETEKAKALLLEAISDSRYTQMSEYNTHYLQLASRIFETQPKKNISKIVVISISIILLLLLVISFYLKKYNKDSSYLTHSIVENNESQLNLSTDDTLKELSSANIDKIKLISLLESYPQISELMDKIKMQTAENSHLNLSIKELENLLNPITSDKIENEIAAYLEKDNKVFYEKIKALHPQLSLMDLRLCTLIKIGLTTKEIAIITNKSVRGIESAKFRMRRKMNLDTSKDLYDYFLEIEKSDK